MNPAAAKPCCARAAVGGGGHPIGFAIQRDSRNGYRGQCRKAPLDIGILRIALGKAEAMAVAVDHDIDIVGIVMRQRRPFEACLIKVPVRRPLLPQDPSDAAPVGGKASPSAFDLEIILVPQRDLALGFGRDHGPRDILDQVAVHAYEPDAALRPQRSANAGRAAAPIVAGENGTLDAERIHQRHQVRPDRGLLARARRRRIAETRRTVATQIGHDDAAALCGQLRGDIHVRMNIVGESVQQHHHRSGGRPFLVPRDIENAGIDMTQRFQPPRRRRACRGGGTSLRKCFSSHGDPPWRHFTIQSRRASSDWQRCRLPP